MILNTGLAYWTQLKGYHQNRANPMMPGWAVRAMRKIETNSPAVQRRVNAFIERHHRGSPSDDSGPELA